MHDNPTPPATPHATTFDRDGLIHVLNTRRSSLQHTVDAIWPWNDEAHRRIRKTFSLPLTRPMGM